MGSLGREFARGAASRRLKEAERRLYGDPPKEAGSEDPAKVGGFAPEGLGRADVKPTRSGDRREGEKG